VNPAWINLAISLALLGSMGFNLVMSARLWLRESGARALRALFMAAMVEIGMIFYVLAAAGRLWAPFVPYARFGGVVVLGSLLIGGIVIPLTWLIPDMREALKRE